MLLVLPYFICSLIDYFFVVGKLCWSKSVGGIRLEVEVSDLVEELEAFPECGHHLYASLPLLYRGIVLTQKLLQVYTIVVKGGDKFSLCHVFGFVD